MIRLGYWYLNEGKTAYARLVFEINLMANPESWNAYDSLAEIYFQQGDSTKAIQYYQQSLKRNPNNTNGRKMLMRLTGN
ncbi:MAG: tetratricopeptide repeat protein [Bacteroidia bacterium]